MVVVAKIPIVTESAHFEAGRGRIPYASVSTCTIKLSTPVSSFNSSPCCFRGFQKKMKFKNQNQN